MGHFAWLAAGVCVFAASEAGAAPSPATGTFPPTQPPAASASASSGVLPPPPPPPPAAPSAPAPAVAGPSAASPPQPPAATAPPAYAPLYPGYAYPPPGYAYYYPPPPAPLKDRFPENAALSSSPFLDVLVASSSWQNRVSQFLNVGVQGGVYLAGRVRLAANILLPTTALTDDYNSDYNNYNSGEGYYYRQPSKAAALFYGATVGIVAVSSSTFLMSPGIAFSRTDVSDYGSSLAVSLPFEWVTGKGLRLGLEFDAGRAFGGSMHLQCMVNVSPSALCSRGPIVTDSRPAGTSILMQFQLGFGFNHPDALPPSANPSTAPNGWPAAPAPAAPAPATPPPAAPPGPPPG